MRFSLADVNPFAVRGLPMPPSVALAMRLTALAILLKGYYSGFYKGFNEPFAPFFQWIDTVPFRDVFQPGLTVLFLLAMVGILCDGRRIRYWCALGAATILTGVVVSRFYYSNNKVYCACLFLLGSLTAEDDQPVFFFAQLSLMYFGASFNKLFEADWLSGQYFDYWLGTLNPQLPYLFFADRLPPLFVGKVLGWSTIAIEMVLCVGFALPHWRVRAAWLAVYFHSAALLLSQRDFGVYTAAIMASLIVVADWPETIRVSYKPNARTHRAVRWVLDRFDADERLSWVATDAATVPRLNATVNGKTFTGWSALKRLLFYSSPVLFVVIFFMTVSQAQYVWWRSAGLLVGLLVFCPMWPLSNAGRRHEMVPG